MKFPRPHIILFLSISLTALIAANARAEEEDEGYKYFLGYETEPNMEYGSRDILSLHAGSCRALGRLLHTDRRPCLALAYELPLASLWHTVHHEIDGHGARAREFDLDPTYGFWFDMSAFTSIGDDPESNQQIIVLAAGGTEASSILSRRALIDAYKDWATDGSIVPLLVMAKLDFISYTLSTSDPGEDETSRDSFEDQYEEGNDIAIYLTARQARRKGADPVAVWERDYVVDFNDELLNENYDDVYITALWSMCDPSTWLMLVPYVKDHIRRGKVTIRPFVLKLGENFGLSLGTRGALGPAEVTRFLDLYLLTPICLATVYVRDLDSTIDRTYGFGGGIYGLRLGRFLELSVRGDHWEEPVSEELFYDGTGWNVSGEIEMSFTERWGLSAKTGSKSEGFLPGAPLDSGFYFGLGITVDV